MARDEPGDPAATTPGPDGTGVDVLGPPARDPRLTPRQRKVLRVIREWVETHGYPPSVREIGEVVGLRSPSSVHHQLAALERAGYLRRDALRPRAMEVMRRGGGGAADHDVEARDVPVRPLRRDDDARVRSVPLVGEIAAGAPILADEQVEDTYDLPATLVGDGTLFALRVRGESMLDAGVLPGDLVVVRQQAEVEQGEMCAALVDDEATVKFFRRTRTGEVFLDPANEAYEPIAVPPDAQSAILGRVVSVLRSL